MGRVGLKGDKYSMLRKVHKRSLMERFLWQPLDLLIHYSASQKNRKTIFAILLVTISLSILPYFFIWKYQFSIDIITNLLYAQGMTYFLSNLLLPMFLSFVVLCLHQAAILALPLVVPHLTYYHVSPVFLMLAAVYFLTYAYTKLKKIDLEKIKVQISLLDAKQARIDNLFDNEFYAIAVHMDGKIWEINETFTKFLDYEASDIIGKNLTSIIDPADREDFLRMMKEQKNFYMELMGVGKGDTRIPLEIISKHYKEAGNDLEICFIRDMTSRVLIHEELKKQKNYLQKILDAYPHSLYIVDTDGTTIKAANKLARKETRDRSFPKYGFNSENWSADYDRALEKAKITKQPQSMEQEYIDGNGNLKIVEIYTYPFLDEEGEITQIIETIIDITARKKAERKLKVALKDLEDMRYALDKHAIVALTDPAGDITYVNDKFVEVSGYTREELLGQNHRILNSGLHSREFFKELWDTISSGNVWQGEIRNQAKDGNYYYVASTIVPLMNEFGKPVQYISIRTDITDQKKTEGELKRAKEDAEEANRAKGTFLANMSHEIRTPLNAVLGMADLTLETKLDPLQNEYVHLIKSSGENLLYLINEILDFSKIEAGKLEINRQPFMMRSTVRSVMQLFFYQGLEKGLKMTLEFSSDLPNEMIGDPQRIKQILINLVGNSIKFTDRGKLEVIISIHSISSEQKAEQGRRKMVVKFLVRDTGIGVSPEKQNLIFESFTQEDSSTTRKYGGTGLGTTISRQLVEYMGGHIGLRSPVNDNPELGGPGSEFWFTLPLEVNLDQFHQTQRTIKESDIRIAYVGNDETEQQVVREYAKKEKIETRFFSAYREFVAAQEPGKCETDLILCGSKPEQTEMQQLVSYTRQRAHKGDPVKLVMINDSQAIDGTFVLFESSIHEYIARPLTRIKLERAMTCAFCDDFDSQDFEPLAAKKSENNASVAKPAQTITGSFSSVQVLVAEDNDINQLLLKTMLEKEGYSVTLANDGKEAVQALQSDPEKYDIVFMDLQMPEMNGFQAAETIRSEITGKVPIIAVTANAFKEDIERTKEAGMNDFIAKPYKKEQILKMLAKWVGEQALQKN